LLGNYLVRQCFSLQFIEFPSDIYLGDLRDNHMYKACSHQSPTFSPTSPSLSPPLLPSLPAPLPRPTHPPLERVHRGVLHHPGELPAAQQEARECRQPQHRGDETSVWPCCIDCMLRLDQSQREVKAPNVLAISIFRNKRAIAWGARVRKAPGLGTWFPG